MSSQRISKQFESIPNQLRQLGPYHLGFSSAIVWQGRVDASNADLAGKNAVVIDFTSATWATGNLRAIIVANPVGDEDHTLALKTQSHAFGHFIDGSVSFSVYMETPTTWVDELAAFQRNVLQHLRGQLSAPVQLNLCPASDEPTLNGVNGETTSATYVVSELMQPATPAPVGGV